VKVDNEECLPKLDGIISHEDTNHDSTYEYFGHYKQPSTCKLTYIYILYDP